MTGWAAGLFRLDEIGFKGWSVKGGILPWS